MRWLQTVLFVLTLPLWPLFWLICRMEAKACPRCESEWRTELVGEWGVEMWKCHNCRYCWETPYGRE